MAQLPAPLPRVLIVADNASIRFGGEAVLPVHYFRVLSARGVEAHLLVHERTRAEMEATFPEHVERLHAVDDTPLQRALWRFGKHLPHAVAEITTQLAINIISQFRMRAAARRLVSQHALDVVHSPTPVSPRLPSALWGLGAPVVFGPMNGGMSYPPGFIGRDPPARRALLVALRGVAHCANRLVPGKRRAASLLVANERTAAALATVAGPPVLEVVENGVDFTRFVATARPPDEARSDLELAFVGRLVEWKGVDLILRAMAVVDGPGVHLTVYGDGPERGPLEALVEDLGLVGLVHFAGFVEQHELAKALPSADALVLPSLFECGGAVVLEAMAVALPVVALRWGGPADYLDEDCAILIDPINQDWVVRELAGAITTLRDDPARRRALGCRGRAKVLARYDWERKVDEVTEIYRAVIARGATDRSSAPGSGCPG